MKYFALFLFSIQFLVAQTISIPDSNLEQALIDQGVDTNGLNGNILTADALAVDSLYLAAVATDNENFPNVSAPITDMSGLEAFTNLSYLNLRFNEISELSFDQNLPLEYLSVGNNLLTSVDAELQFTPQLKTLFLNDNLLTDFTPGSSVPLNELETLGLQRNSIQNLGVQAANLKTLWIHTNPGLTQLFLEPFSKLEACHAYDNPDLESVYFPNFLPNPIKRINLNNCPNLTGIGIPNEPLALEQFYIANTALVYTNGLDLSNLHNLKWVEVDNLNLGSLSVTGLESIEWLRAENNQLQSLDVGSAQNLYGLFLSGNDLTELDVSNNQNLEFLFAGRNDLNNLNLTHPKMIKMGVEQNNLSELNLSQMTELTELFIDNNPITTVDDMCGLTKLTRLSAGYLNLSSPFRCWNSFPDLLELDFSGNSIEEFTVQYMPSLKRLSLENTHFQPDFSNNPELEFLAISNNNIRHVPWGKFPNLHTVWANNTELKSVSFPTGTQITNLHLEDNPQLELVDLSERDMTQIEAYSSNDTPIFCVQVNDSSSPPANWSYDSATTFSTACTNYQKFAIPDTNLEAALIAAGIDNNGITNDMYALEARNVERLLLDEQQIADMSGIENFVDLQFLSAKENAISTIDLSSNSILQHVRLDSNQINTISFANNISLQQIHLTENNLSAIDVRMLPFLIALYVSENNLTELDISQNPQLLDVRFSGNAISNVDFSQNPELLRIDAQEASLTHIDLSNNPQINRLALDGNSLTGLDVGNLPDLRVLTVGNNAIDSLNLRSNPLLIELKSWGNELTELDLSNNTELQHLDFFDNQIVSLDVSQLNQLKRFFGGKNPMPILDLTAATNIEYVSVNENTSLQELYLDNLTSDYELDARQANNLDCIQVASNYADNPSETWFYESHQQFKTDCSNIWTIYTQDDNLYTALANNSNIDVNGDGEVTHEEAENYTGTLDLTNQNITDITGLLHFENINHLNLANNAISSVADLFLGGQAQEQSSSSSETMQTAHLELNNLHVLNLSHNQIVELNLSQQENLTSVDVSNNQLETFVIQNANNKAITNFNAMQNPNLRCIQVDDSNFSAINWLEIDNQTQFSEDCTGLLASLESIRKPLDVVIYPNPAANYLNIQIPENHKLQEVRIWDASGKVWLVSGKRQLDLGALPSGNYFLEIQMQKGKVTQRFIKK